MSTYYVPGAGLSPAMLREALGNAESKQTNKR